MSIKDLRQSQELIEVLTKFAANPQGFIILSGKNGVGKTYAAKEVFNAVSPYAYGKGFDPEIALMYTQAQLHVLYLKHHTEWGHPGHLIETLCLPKLLIIDDLGTRTPTDAFMDFIYNFTDDRSCNRKTKGTLITTNRNVKELRETFGDAFTSRTASDITKRIEDVDRRFFKLDTEQNNS